MDRNLSELELAIETVVKHYDKYSKKTLAFWKEPRIGKKDFRELLTQQLSHMLTSTECRAAAEEMFNELDKDGDGYLRFNEYWDLVGRIANTLARASHQQKESVK